MVKLKKLYLERKKRCDASLNIVENEFSENAKES